MYSVNYQTIIITKPAHHNPSVSATLNTYIHVVEHERKYVTTYRVANLCVFIYIYL